MANSNYNGALKTAGFVVTVLVLAVGGGIAWGDLQSDVDTVTTTVAEIKTEQAQKVDEKEFDEVKEKVNETHDSVIKLETEMKNVNENLKLILEKLDQ